MMQVREPRPKGLLGPAIPAYFETFASSTMTWYE